MADNGAGARPLGELLDRWRLEGRLVGEHVRSAGVGPGQDARAVSLSGVREDSRRVEPGDLFVAVRGLRVDGHEFVQQALDRGVAAVAVEHPVGDLGVPQLVVDRGSAALASAAAWWYGDPSRELLTVGITGTNGKTTTSFLVAAALEAGGLKGGLIGTIGIRAGGELVPHDEPNTTPGSIDLQRILREMVDAGLDAVVLESSSHGLAADRVASVDYDAAIFTNLSHEHLDFHGTFEAYRDAKRSLFERLPEQAKGGRPSLAVINLDDAHGAAFGEAAAATGARVITYGTDTASVVELVHLEADAASCRMVLDIGGDPPVEVVLPIAGRFNAHNAMAAIGLAYGWGLDIPAVIGALQAFPGVPGRMEVISRGQPFGVVIDYAHTPRSIEAATSELRALVEPKGGSVISLFGASGERDVGKRPLMGEAAARHSRIVIVTEDDSRGEDPASIFEQIAAGAEKVGKRRDDDLLLIGDRRAAIAESFRQARAQDVVFLAGKGHETWNMGPDGPVPWSDRDEAEAALAALHPEGR